MRGLSNPPDLPDLRAPAPRPTGPLFLPKGETIIGGYGEPPPGFVTGQTSLTEWIFYWSLAKVFKDPKDPRVPPYYGGRDWGYQIAKLGGFVRAVGSTVIDFVVYQGPTVIGIRIQTEHFHIFTSSRKHSYDMLQRAQIENAGIRVVDVYDTELLGDPSGQKAVIAAKRAIAMIEKQNPVLSGTAARGSRLKVLT